MRRDRVALLVLWLAAGGVLAVVASHVRDWFDMTDEMRYERLAISIAQTHSLVPRIHGVDIRSYSQLYPLLIAPAFARGHVPGDLIAAHVENAFLMASACIPAFLLARRVTGRRLPAYLLALASVCVPWILYTTMLMTEVAAYPVFLWAMLAFQRTLAAPSWRNDLLALLVLPLAYLARTALVVLVLVLPVALVAFEAGRLGRAEGRPRPLGTFAAVLRSHRLLTAAYAAILAGALALKASDRFSTLFGVYGYYASNQTLFGRGFAGALVAHVATFSLAIGVLPLVAGLAWLSANVLRPPASRERHAFACIGAVTFAGVVIQVAAFDLRYVDYVHDRFLVYLAPLVLIGLACALADRRLPRLSLLAPAALVALGFVFGGIPPSDLDHAVPLDPDDPAGIFYEPVARLAHGLGGARALLAVAAVALAALYALGAARARRRVFALVVGAFAAAALAGETSYAYARMFGEKGPSTRPVTANMNGAYDWVDGRVGTGANVTMIPYPVSSNFFVTERTWRDYEFWNKSVDRDVHYPYPQVFESTGFWFPKVYIHFDHADGRADVTLTPYVLQADQESRFRIAGTALVDQSGVMLVRADRPWRAAWLTTSGLYEDGWTKPGKVVRIRVYAYPGQRRPRIRWLTLGLRAPDGIAARPVSARSDVARWHGAAGQGTVWARLDVCVPARGYTVVTMRARGVSGIPPNQRDLDFWTQTGRAGGVFVSEVDLADEIGPACRG